MNGPPVGSGSAWVDVASRAIVQVGFPVVVAAVLLWFLLGKFQTNMDTITTRMLANTDGVRDVVAAEQQTLEELQAQTQELRRIAETLERTAKREEGRGP